MELERHWINSVANGAKRNETSFLFHLPEKMLEQKDEDEKEEE